LGRERNRKTGEKRRERWKNKIDRVERRGEKQRGQRNCALHLIVISI